MKTYEALVLLGLLLGYVLAATGGAVLWGQILDWWDRRKP